MTVKTLERAGNCLRLLDQTQLPTKEIYNDYDNYQDIIKAIQRLEVRGAPAIGIAAAYGMAVGVAQTGDFSLPNIENIGLDIKNARPTAVNLSWAVDRVLNLVRKTQPESLEGCLELLWGEAAAIHEEDRLMCRKIGENGAELIKDGEAVLTHCNTGALATGGIGTALAVIYVCHEKGKNIKVFADETRPLLQGARLTAWELQKAGIDITLNTDNMAGMLMKERKINCVIVGADRIAANGDTANKIGTYSVAVLARAHKVPFYVAAPMTTFDLKTESGADINIEMRAVDEVTSLYGVPIAPAGIKVYSPAFDITPIELISGFITDEGVRPGGRKK